MSKMYKQHPFENIKPLGQFKEGENRRIKGDRLDVSIPIYVAIDPQTPMQGYFQSVNMSWSGLLMETDIIFNEGDEMIVEFNLPQTQFNVRSRARIIRKMKHPHPELTYIGVLFSQMDPNIRRMLSGYVLEHMPV